MKEDPLKSGDMSEMKDRSMVEDEEEEEVEVVDSSQNTLRLKISAGMIKNIKINN